MRWTTSAFCLATLLSLAAPPRLLAGDSPGIAPGTWVRVNTDSEVSGDGFRLTPREAQGRSLAHDKKTMTFEVNGKPLRVARPDKSLEGPVRSLDGDNLVLGGPDDAHPIVISRGDIASLDVRRRSSKKGAGILIGLLAGGLVGVAIGSAHEPDCVSQNDESNYPLGNLCLNGLAEGGGGVLGAAAGALIGGLIAPGSKWEKDYPFERVRVSVVPTRGRGVGLRLSLNF